MATKILVVDDDINICELLRLNLTQEGYEVKTVSDGSEGVAAISMVIAIIIPIYNILAVIILEIFRGGQINVKKIIINIFNKVLRTILI